MNSNKLKRVMKEKDIIYSEAAKTINISTTSFNAKISGKRQFTLHEINGLIRFLNLNQNEIKIFFCPILALYASNY